jgi:hypothetical protein
VPGRRRRPRVPVVVVPAWAPAAARRDLEVAEVAVSWVAVPWVAPRVVPRVVPRVAPWVVPRVVSPTWADRAAGAAGAARPEWMVVAPADVVAVAGAPPAATWCAVPALPSPVPRPVPVPVPVPVSPLARASGRARRAVPGRGCGRRRAAPRCGPAGAARRARHRPQGQGPRSCRGPRRAESSTSSPRRDRRDRRPVQVGAATWCPLVRPAEVIEGRPGATADAA